MRGHLVLILGLLSAPSANAFLGTEIAPLLQLVSGQVQEIQRLTESVGVAKDQVELLRGLNEGIDRAVTQIQTLHQIVERAQGLDPTAVRSISDLNDLLLRANNTKGLIEEMLELRIGLADQAIARSALQTDTAYRMGQEMVLTGSQLALESQTASPGRASQISAAAGSAQMLSQGVQLQTLAQVAELQALLLEFHKTQLAEQLRAEKLRRAQVERELVRRPSRRRS